MAERTITDYGRLFDEHEEETVALIRAARSLVAQGDDGWPLSEAFLDSLNRLARAYNRWAEITETEIP